jgi:hypothetical protein
VATRLWGGLLAGFNWPSALIALTAFVALFQYKVNMIKVIVGFEVIGLLHIAFKYP